MDSLDVGTTLDLCGSAAAGALLWPFSRRLARFFDRQLNRLVALRSRKGPYRFLVASWDRVDDLGLATRILDAECFRKRMAPYPLPISRLSRILVLAPHPDDETIGAGGALLLASRAGADVRVLYLTDGAQVNGCGTPEEVVRIRRSEAEEVCGRIHASIDWLDISNIRIEPSRAHLKRLGDAIREYRPDVIMAPWLLDTPAKHRMTYHLLWLANQLRPLPNVEMWGYQVHNAMLPNAYVDITSVGEEKRALLSCFRSQNRYRHYDHIAMGVAAANSRLLPSMDAPRYLETFLTLPLEEVLRMVEKFYFQDLEATYLEEPGVIPGIARLHREVTASGGGMERPLQ